MITQKPAPPLRFKEFNESWAPLVLGSFISPRIEFCNSDDNFELFSLTLESGVTPKTDRYNRTHLVKSDEDAYKVVHPGDFVYNPMNVRFGAVARYTGDKKISVSKYYDVFSASSSVNTKFLAEYLKTHKTLGFYNRVATGALDEKKRVHFSDFVGFERLFPTKAEQQKIAEFLSSVDKKMSLLKEKHALLRQYKKGVMQKLFKQEIRFKDDTGNDFPDWQTIPMSKLASKNSAKNKDESVNTVLTNSAKDGIVNQGDYFKKDIANQQNLGGYTVVEKNDFVYNPRISELAPVGPIKRNHIGQGVMSPLYTVFRFKDDSLLDYLEKYFNTTMWHRYMHSIANFGARHDRMNITTSDFYALPLPIPCMEERLKIVNFVSVLEAKIDAVKQQIELTQTFKKGLLQQMFV